MKKNVLSVSYWTCYLNNAIFFLNFSQDDMKECLDRAATLCQQIDKIDQEVTSSRNTVPYQMLKLKEMKRKVELTKSKMKEDKPQPNTTN